MCEYCGCREITVIGRYTLEHEAIVNLLTELRTASQAVAGEAAGPADAAGRARLRAAAQAMAGALDPHTVGEEQGLFAVLREDPDFEPHVKALCAEHVHLDAQLASVAAGEPAAYERFEHALRAHIDKEENGLFPAAAVAVSGEQWEQIVASLDALDHSSGTIEIEPHGHSATHSPHPLQ